MVKIFLFYSSSSFLESFFNGHYSISILPRITSNFEDTEQVLTFGENERIEEKWKKLIKLHKQFGHISSSNLLNSMKNAGVETKNISKIVQEITKQCNICKLYKKLLARPVVSISKYRYSNTEITSNTEIFKF